MSRRAWERAIWASTAAVLVLATLQIRADRKADAGSWRTARSASRSASTSTLMMFDADSLDSAATHVAGSDPFRLERKPATVAFSSTPTGATGPPVPAAPPVSIALQGTIGGPPWQAIISGVPGHNGAIVVSSGDTLGGVAIRRVNRDSVTVRVRDSTWTVTLAKSGA